jgi:deoxycytidylate deaminase
MKDVYKLAYMDMACRFAQTSHAERLKVGSLIVKNNSIISLGEVGEGNVKI